MSVYVLIYWPIAQHVGLLVGCTVSAYACRHVILTSWSDEYDDRWLSSIL